MDRATRAFFEPRYGRDLSQVRVHAGDQAASSADALGARAYTVGPDIVFGRDQFHPGTPEGRHLLSHELAHMAFPHAAVMRAPLPDESQPRTIIIAYGAGQVSPVTNSHNVGIMFKTVAAQKLSETKARLGKDASKHTFVFEYTPTEAELQAVLNKKYAAPVAEVHLFSHGWSEGANLGGPVPATGPTRPTTETPKDAEERRMRPDDLSKYSIEFADDAVVVFYGCNIGNAASADNATPFAQDFADYFGVRVTASTRSTHFENTGGWHQVPDPGGKMIDFAPSSAHARDEVKAYLATLVELAKTRAEFNVSAKQGIIGLMIREDRIRARIATQEAAAKAKRAVAHRMIGFLPVAEQGTFNSQIEQGEAAAGLPQ